MDSVLARLLSPVPPDRFFEHFSARTSLHIKHGQSNSNHRDNLSLEDLDRVFQSELIPADTFKVVSEGKHIAVTEWSRIVKFSRDYTRIANPEDLLSFYLNGATIVLDTADRAIPKLGTICRGLTRELRFPVHANLYITPPAAQGFARHFDEHEVLILQIFGSKIWDLFPEDSAHEQITMEVGDFLYIPRLLSHEARSTAEASIHVTIGLYPLYGFKLLEELSTVASQNNWFQQPLFAHPAGDVFRRAIESELGSRIERLTTMQEFEVRRFRHLVDNQAPGWEGRLHDLLRVTNLGPETRVRLRRDILTVIEEEGETISVHFAGKTLNVPRFLRISLDRLLNGARLKVNELPGLLSTEGKVEMIRKFVNFGLLEIVEE